MTRWAAMFNPLLDAEVADVALAPADPWQVVSERVQAAIERAARRSDVARALKELNLLDLIDGEAAAYWSNEGWRLHGGKAFLREQARQLHGLQASPVYIPTGETEQDDNPLLY